MNKFADWNEFVAGGESVMDISYINICYWDDHKNVWRLADNHVLCNPGVKCCFIMHLDTMDGYITYVLYDGVMYGGSTRMLTIADKAVIDNYIRHYLQVIND